MQIQNNNYSYPNFTSLKIGEEALKELQTKSPKLRRQVAEWVKKYEALPGSQDLLYIPKGSLAKAGPDAMKKYDNTWRVSHLSDTASTPLDIQSTKWVKDSGFHFTHPALQVLKEMYTTLTDSAYAVLDKATRR